LAHEGAPWYTKARLEGDISYFQGTPWAHFVFNILPRRTLAHEGAPWHMEVHLGT